MDIASIDMSVVTVLRLVAWANVAVAVAFLMGVIVFAICCGTDCWRERKKGRTPGMVLLALLLTGCTPQFQHLDGHSLTPVTAPLQVDNGWMVFDSCAGGVHAVIEIQVETLEPRLRPPDFDRVAFRLASSYDWRKGQILVEGPFCPWDRPEHMSGAQLSYQHDRVNRVTYGTEPRCTYFVMAQFELDQLPTPGDSLVVLQGKRMMRLAWR